MDQCPFDAAKEAVNFVAVNSVSIIGRAFRYKTKKAAQHRKAAKNVVCR